MRGAPRAVKSGGNDSDDARPWTFMVKRLIRLMSRGTMYGVLPLLGALSMLGACNRRDAPRAKPDLPAPGAHAVTIRQPARLGRVRLGAPPRAPGAAQSSGGLPVKCETCHALRPPAPLPESMLELDQFHQGLELQHGSLRCAACHTEKDSTTLHLADGRKLRAGQAMELCRQCHGPQYRDYEHGAHGGMTGYWDLTRGPRVKNHCVDCHDPHAPQIRQVIPAPPPRDRFFGQRAHAPAAHNEGIKH